MTRKVTAYDSESAFSKRYDEVKQEHPDYTHAEILDTLVGGQSAPANTIEGTDQSAGELTSKDSPESPRVNEPEIITAKKPGYPFLVNGDNERLYTCIQGAYETDGLEVYPRVKLVVTHEAGCPIIQHNPNIPITVLAETYCMPEKKRYRCPVLDRWDRLRVLETAAKLKQQNSQEKLQLDREIRTQPRVMDWREKDRQERLMAETSKWKALDR
jgi:hypothetical protein